MALNSDHVASLTDSDYHDPGCVMKCVKSGQAFTNKGHGAYRRNGYKSIKGDGSKRDRYELPGALKSRVALFGIPSGTGGPRIGAITERKHGGKATDTVEVKDPSIHEGAWAFEGNNFKQGNTPYNHNYHHMIPWDVIKNTMSLNEAELLMKAKYNLNNGINLIILPMFTQVGLILGLHTHPNDHGTGYTARLISFVNEIRDELAPDTDDDDGHELKEEDLVQIKQMFEDWEKEEWWKIADAGWAAHAAHINTYSPSSMTVSAGS